MAVILIIVKGESAFVRVVDKVPGCRKSVTVHFIVEWNAHVVWIEIGIQRAFF